MNAQEYWKRYYTSMMRCVLRGFDIVASSHRDSMMHIRREAALERRIAALERENARLKPTVTHAIVFLKDTDECLFCGYPYREDGARGHEDFCTLKGCDTWPDYTK